MPEVTIVIPAFNPGRHIDDSLQSCVDQTFRDWECIVLDDGSAEAVEEQTKVRDSRIRHHRQSNRGVSVARNVAVSLSDSSLVAFLDQDDAWQPRKLELQVEALRTHANAAFSHTRFTWRLPGVDRPSPETTATYRASLAGEVHVLMSSLVVARDKYVAVGGCDPMLRQQQDWALVLQLLRAYGEPVLVREALVDYRLHAANASQDYSRAAAEARGVLLSHLTQASHDGDEKAAGAARAGLKAARKLYASQAIEVARQAKAEGQWGLAVRHVRRAASLSPAGLMSTAGVSARARTARVAAKLAHRSSDTTAA